MSAVFKPATEYTRDCFPSDNPILECCMGRFKYDLTVFAIDDKFKVGHGGIIMPDLFESIADAKAAIMAWYYANAQQ